jgi:hypothetical protein
MTTPHDPAHITTDTSHHTDRALLDDAIDRALDELARAGIGFEIISDDRDLERAA